jgi:hypothetical protein
MDSSREELLRAEMLRAEMLKKAVELHGTIEPTRTRSSLEECFTTEDSKLILWFNDKSGTTKVLVKEAEEQP